MDYVSSILCSFLAAGNESGKTCHEPPYRENQALAELHVGNKGRTMEFWGEPPRNL